MDYKQYAKLNKINLDSPDPIFEVSNLITEARLHAGLSQAQLANLIGTKQPSIARAEKGSVVPSVEFLKKIADAIGTYLVPPKFGFMVEQEENDRFKEFEFKNKNLSILSVTHSQLDQQFNFDSNSQQIYA
jgi:transcriptional regulator with XRE-family HTH domain